MTHKMRRAQFATVIDKAADGTPTTFVISTGAVDRDRDTVDPSGWVLDNYRRNPVVLFAHDYSSLPVGKCTDIRVVNHALVATMEWAPHEFADTVKTLVKDGFLNATSVGFRPLERELNDTGGLHFAAAELLEFSIVPVPANPQALIVERALSKWLKPSDESGDVIDIVDDTDAVKSGRVLANRNATKVKEARRLTRHATDKLVESVTHLTDVLSDAGHDEDDDSKTLVEIDPDVFAEALRDALGDIRRDVRANVRAQVRRALADPLLDPAARHRDEFDIDPAMLRAACALAIPDIVRRIAITETRRALDRARGRVD